MDKEIDVFTTIPHIPESLSLGTIKAYITQGTTSQCCVDHAYHRHACYEVAWVSGGRSRYFVDFREYVVPAGSLVFVSPGQVHQWQGLDEQSDLIVIGFTPDLFAIDLTDIQKTLIDLPFFVEDASPVYTMPHLLEPILQNHFQTALERATSQPNHAEMLLRAYLNLILVEAQNAIHTKPSVETQKPPAPIRLTRRFRLAVENNFVKRKQVQDYADQLGVTTNHLVEMVRETSGFTPKRIIQDRLLLEAKRLLAYSTLSAAEIGSELSFSDPSQFGRWFRTNAGVAPGQFRQQLTF